jgi:hypothetical protein
VTDRGRLGRVSGIECRLRVSHVPLVPGQRGGGGSCRPWRAGWRRRFWILLDRTRPGRHDYQDREWILRLHARPRLRPEQGERGIFLCSARRPIVGGSIPAGIAGCAMSIREDVGQVKAINARTSGGWSPEFRTPGASRGGGGWRAGGDTHFLADSIILRRESEGERHDSGNNLFRAASPIGVPESRSLAGLLPACVRYFSSLTFIRRVNEAKCCRLLPRTYGM